MGKSNIRVSIPSNLLQTNKNMPENLAYSKIRCTFAAAKAKFATRRGARVVEEARLESV